MTHHSTDPTTISDVLEHLAEQGLDGMARAIEILLNEAMKIERSEYLQAAQYERTEDRRGYANGFKPKSIKSRVGQLDLAVPKVRDMADDAAAFYPKSLERGQRSERALKLAVAEMYVQGVSTRKVAQITRELCGVDISSQQASRAAKLLDEELESWRTRPLGDCPYVLLDARYEKVRHGGRVITMAVLWAVGVGPDGKRKVLGVSTSFSEAEVHWRNFLRSLVQRGLENVQMVTSDSHEGLKAALRAVLSGVAWQRCQFHLQQNAGSYVPRVEMREKVAIDIRAVFNARDRHEADRLLAKAVKSYHKTAPKLSLWMEDNIPEGLTVFSLPINRRRRLRTSNLLERVNRELKRRTRVASLFPNEASLLRLVTAILAEKSEEWETGRSYIRMNEV